MVLVALELGDFRPDGDQAAVAGAPLVDLQPAAVGELDLARLRGSLLVAAGDAALDRRPPAGRFDGGPGIAGPQHVLAQPVGLPVDRVAKHQAVVPVPEHEGFRGALERFEQPLVGFRRALREAVLLGDVHGDADQVGLVRTGVDDFGAGAHPDIVALGVAHAEDVVDLRRLALRDGAGDRVEVVVVGVHEPRGLAEREHAVTWRQAEHLVHGRRPVEPAARHVPVPEPAAPARQRGIHPPVGFQVELVRVAGTGRLGKIRVEDDDQDARRGDEQGGIQRNRAAPPALDAGERRHHEHGTRLPGEATQGGDETVAAVFHRNHPGPRAEAEQPGLVAHDVGQPVPDQRGGDLRRCEDPPAGVGNEDDLAVRPVFRQGVADQVLDATAILRRDGAEMAGNASRRGRRRERGRRAQPRFQFAAVAGQRKDAGRRDDQEEGDDQERDEPLERRLGTQQVLVGRLGEELGVSGNLVAGVSYGCKVLPPLPHGSVDYMSLRHIVFAFPVAIRTSASSNLT